jgi:hypothetical protein
MNRTEISYHCLTNDDLQKTLNHFKVKGYTFNGEKDLHFSLQGLGVKGMDGFIGIIIHVNHKKQDLSYDYYYIEHPEKLEKITNGNNLIDCNILFREEKLKRILNEKN